jgi:hypothetical protein
VPFTVTLVTSALGNQTFQLFLNKISGGADSFVMALDSGLGLKDHQCQINSAINIDTSDGINWNIAFSLLAERTDIQEDVCLTANLPDLFGCYGDELNCFLDASLRLYASITDCSLMRQGSKSGGKSFAPWRRPRGSG